METQIDPELLEILNDRNNDRNNKIKLLARFLTEVCFRNSELENLHCGISPSSKIGDYSDVKVVSPYGEISWNEVSRFNDKEMRVLMLNVEKQVDTFLKENFPSMINSFVNKKGVNEFLKRRYERGVSWDWNDYENQLKKITDTTK